MKLFYYKSIYLSNLVKKFSALLFLIVILVLSNSIGGSVFAENENHLRSSNKRLWSIISDKIPFESKYSPENIRKSTPKQELLKTPPPKEKYQNTNAKKILKLLQSPTDLEKFSKDSDKKYTSSAKYSLKESHKKYTTSAKNSQKESHKTYTTSSKGRAGDMHEDPIAISQFCETQATTTFCIRRGVGRFKYVGNTPRKHPRDLDFSGKNLANRKKGSKKLIQSLIKNQNRSN